MYVVDDACESWWSHGSQRINFKSQLSSSTLLKRVHCFCYATLSKLDWLWVSSKSHVSTPPLALEVLELQMCTVTSNFLCVLWIILRFWCLCGNCFYLQTRLVVLVHISYLALCLFQCKKLPTILRKIKSLGQCLQIVQLVLRTTLQIASKQFPWTTRKNHWYIWPQAVTFSLAYPGF